MTSPGSDGLQMKAYVAELNDIDVNMSVPLDGNGSYLCFDIDKYGCIGQMPRVVKGPFLKKGYHREVRVPDELVLSVRTVAEVARATEPLIARVLEDYRGLCENWEAGAQKMPVIDV